jgi:hypothetical protein
VDDPIVGGVSGEASFSWDGTQWVGALSPDGSSRWSGCGMVRPTRPGLSPGVRICGCHPRRRSPRRGEESM